MLTRAIFLSEHCNFWQPYWICRPAGVWWHNWTKIPTFWSCATPCPRSNQDWTFFEVSVYIKLGRGNNSNDLKPLIVLEDLNEVPKTIRHVSSTIRELDLANNCITALKNMENMIFRNLATIYLMRNRIFHLNHMSLQLPALSFISLSENQLTHLGDMSTCQWGMANKRSGFVTITLEHNRWHCNGSMPWLQSSLCKDSQQLPLYYIRQPQGLIIEISRLICQSPLGFQR